MNLVPLLFDLSAQLGLIIQARKRADVEGEQAALTRADRLLVEYGRARMVRGEPAGLARKIINTAARRAMAVTPRAGDPGPPAPPPRRRKPKARTGKGLR